MSFDSLSNLLCDIELNTPGQNANTGQQADSWASVFPDQPCRLDPKAGGVTDVPEYIFDKTTHILFMRNPLIPLSTGTADSDSADHLVDSGATFETDRVVVGALVKNTIDGNFGRVLAINSETDLTLDGDVFPDGNETYIVYSPILEDRHRINISGVIYKILLVKRLYAAKILHHLEILLELVT